MTDPDKISKLEALNYFIDLGWLEYGGRSFVIIAQHCLCPSCQGRLNAEQKDVQPDLLITSIRDCCSRAPDFISQRLPLLEKIFGLFLSHGNEPLSLAELSAELTAYLDNPALSSPRTLKCLLDKDHYYGFNFRSRGKQEIDRTKI